MNKKCQKCGIIFLANSNHQIYCGSRGKKKGCSYNVYLEYHKQDKFKEYYKKYNKKYWAEHKRELTEYHQKNQKRYNEHARRYYKVNIQKNKDKWQKYYRNNKLKIKKHRKDMNFYSDRLKQRRNKDINYRILQNLRNRIWRAVKRFNKSAKSQELIGCSSEELIEYLENQFVNGMSWDNYGKWHIDHIQPCSTFDMSEPDEQKKCFHYTNLQPLWAKDNLSKRFSKKGGV